MTYNVSMGTLNPTQSLIHSSRKPIPIAHPCTTPQVTAILLLFAVLLNRQTNEPMNWERRITSEAEVIKMAIAIEEDRLMCYFAIVLRSSRLSERIADLGARHASLQPPDETIDLAVCTVSHC